MCFGNKQLPSSGGLVLSAFMTVQKFLVNAADTIHVQPLLKTYMLQINLSFLNSSKAS